MIRCKRFLKTPEPLLFFLQYFDDLRRRFLIPKGLNPFGLRILQIVDFGTTSGAERSSEPQIGIFDFQLFGLQVFAPIDFSAENQKSLRRFGKRPAPARSGPKIKAVLPPSHLIGRARIYNKTKTILHWLLLLGSKADSTASLFHHSAFSKGLSKRRRCLT